MDYFVGDIHGRAAWKAVQAVKKPNDHVFFMGDYFDVKEPEVIPFADQLDNFYEIGDWMATDPEHIHLLIGNHDAQYMDGQHTGDYQQEHIRDIQIAFMSYTGDFKMYYEHNGHLISHAGICHDGLNMQEYCNSSYIRLNELPVSFYDYSKTDGLSHLWIRPEELLEHKPLEGYDQVFGHTPDYSIRKYKSKSGDSLFCVDCAGLVPYFKRDTLRSYACKLAHRIKKATGCSLSEAMIQGWRIAKSGKTVKEAMLTYTALFVEKIEKV